ncbi:hypothetical protein GCM10011393_28570 [Sphingopyxis bauzanensis]|nr:hypothetical protein GCM10011393_28570 [Sphingopyxis bauzanensis]
MLSKDVGVMACHVAVRAHDVQREARKAFVRAGFVRAHADAFRGEAEKELRDFERKVSCVSGHKRHVPI